jgi:hypothetical protein
VNNLFTSKNMMSVLFAELWTCRAFLLLVTVTLPLRRLLLCFWIITINPTFVTHYDPRYMSKSWVLVSLLSQLKTHVYTPLLLNTVKSRGTNFAAMGTCSNFLLRSPGKLHNWSQWCLRAHGLLAMVFVEEFSNFFTFSVILLVPGHPEHSSSSTDT